MADTVASLRAQLAQAIRERDGARALVDVLTVDTKTSAEGPEGHGGSEDGPGRATPATAAPATPPLDILGRAFGEAADNAAAPVPLPPCLICQGFEANRLVPHEHDCPTPGRRAVVELIDSEWVASAAAQDPRDPGPIAADALADPENAGIVDAFVAEIRRER